MVGFLLIIFRILFFFCSCPFPFTCFFPFRLW
jgi:hypothetical protein